MTGNDPTDQALAVIASIFEKPAPKPDAKARGEKGDDASSDVAAQDDIADDTSREDAFRDDTSRDDTALDEIARDETAQGGGDPAADDVVSVQIETVEIVEITMTSSEQPEPADVVSDAGPEDLDALTRHGPGPLEALRFKWSVRHEDDGYYVDETIGTSSQPIVAGPLSRAEAIAFIDTRERRTRRRFERLRNEIVSGPSERGVEDDDSEL
ncbi:hypothetical protein SR870_07025 [Rhodopseudomonas palustris]|uniref:hypothetical protein n=1 Tax=Rhodopseudomonas palustris TaxID=1076 RepID=UPI002ACEE344|nr:hypothetical protein [Rhodopseudomonas palustris]WQH01020.1 hypothetical protein SR870_07025 [Rhodopseudomonas palustris]